MRLFGTLLFGVLIFCITFLIYVYPVTAIAHLLTGSAIVSDTGLWVSLAIAGLILFYFRTHASSALLSGLTYFGMGFGFIGFLVTSIGLAIAQFIPHASFSIGLICLSMFAIISFIAAANGTKVQIKQVQISSDKLSTDRHFAFISDVHIGSNHPAHLAKLCQHINQLEHEAVLIGGDLFDSSAFQTADVAALRTLEKPIYFVTGNHEFYVRDHATKIASLGEFSVQNIDNQTADLGEINLIGIGDRQSVAKQADVAQSAVKDDKFNLILVHQPGLWGKQPASTDFMISGHTHNGQIFPFNLLVRLQFNAVYGLYRHGNTQLYVSSGSGTWGPRLRLGTANEIIHLTIKAA